MVGEIVARNRKKMEFADSAGNADVSFRIQSHVREEKEGAPGHFWGQK